MKETLFAAMVASVAMATATIFAQEGGAAQGRFAIFPTNATVRCVIDGKAIESFPTLAELKDKLGANAALAGKALETPISGKISFYAFAVVPVDGAATGESGKDDSDSGFEVVMFAGLADNVTFGEFRSAVIEVLDKGAGAGGKPVGYVAEELGDGGLRIVMRENAGEGDGEGEGELVTLCFMEASPSLAVLSGNEAVARESVAAIKCGAVVAPAIPFGNALAWISASIDPEALFGEDEDDGDAGEGSILDGMPFLAEMTNILAVVEGMNGNGALRVSAIGGFASVGGASSAAGMLSALLRMASATGDVSNPLVTLGRRLEVVADGVECRLAAVFPRSEIEAFFSANGAIAEEDDPAGGE